MKPEITQGAIMALIVGMALANFLQRFLPMAVFSKLDMPKPFLRWLSFVPIAVMGSLVGTQVLRPGDVWQPLLTNPGLYAAALTAIAFRLSRSFLGATLVGIVSFVALRSLLG